MAIGGRIVYADKTGFFGGRARHGRRTSADHLHAVGGHGRRHGRATGQLPYTVGLVVVLVFVLLAALPGAPFGPDLTPEARSSISYCRRCCSKRRWRCTGAIPAPRPAAHPDPVVAWNGDRHGDHSHGHDLSVYRPAPSALVCLRVLISATDPVAIIAMFKDNKLKGRLCLLVESESLFNDGAAAVLFALALAWAHGKRSRALRDGHVDDAGPHGRGRDWRWRKRRRRSYLVRPRHLRASGRGHPDHHRRLRFFSRGRAPSRFRRIGDGHGGPPHGQSRRFKVSRGKIFISPEGARGRGDLLGIRGFSGQFRGVSADRRQRRQDLPHLGSTEPRFSPAPSPWFWAGRALTVYPLSLAFRGSRWAISVAEQHVLWWGGLRGALGLALALSLPSELPLRNEIVVVTFGVVAFSIIAQGLTMPLLLRWLGFLPAPSPLPACGERVRARGRVTAPLLAVCASRLLPGHFRRLCSRALRKPCP